MTDSLRQKQIREILDVWQNVGQQVFQREKRQAQVMEEGVLPKKQKDYETEVGITKGVEGMNRLLETKLLALEQALTNSSGKALSEVMSVAETVNGFNALVRLYSRSGLSRDSQESAKVRFQDLSDDINAVVYGYEQLLDMMFSQIQTSPSVLNVMRAAAVYRAIKDQLYESHSAMAFSPLTQGDIQNAYKDLYAEQSQERRDILNRFKDGAAPERTLTSLPLRNFPVIGSNIDERIASLESEHGIELSDAVKKQMRQIKPSLASSEFAQFEAEQNARRRIEQELLYARQKLSQTQNAQAQLVREMEQLNENADIVQQALRRGTDEDGEELKEADIRQMEFDLTGYERDLEKKNAEYAPIEPRIEELLATIQNLEEQLQSVKVHAMGEYQRQKAYDPSKAKDIPMPEAEELKYESPSAASSSASASAPSDVFLQMSKSVRPYKDELKSELKKRGIKYTQRDSRDELIQKFLAATQVQVRPVSELRLTPSRRGPVQEVEGEVAAQAAPGPEEEYVPQVDVWGMPDPLEADGKPHRVRGLASMRRRYGHEDSSSSDSDSESDLDEYRPQHMRRRACEFNDSRNDMYD